MVVVDLPLLSAASFAPAHVYSIVNSVFSDPANYRIDINPLGPSGSGAQANKYNITRVSDGHIFQNSPTGPTNWLNDANVVAAAIRYIGAPGVIDLAPGLSVGNFYIGYNDSGQGSVAYWSTGLSPSGPFQPIQGLTIRSRDRLNKAKIGGFQISTNIKVGANVVTMGPVSMTFEDIEMKAPGPGTRYICQMVQTAPDPQVHGLFAFYDCDFTGQLDYDLAGIYDCKSAIRGSYLSWLFMRCRFPVCEEHGLYSDAPQGQFVAVDCYNTSNTGLAKAQCGNTLFQIDSRSSVALDPQLGGSNYGGPPGFGKIGISGCVATRTGSRNPSGAFTIGGFLGDVYIKNCRANDCRGGMITIWTDDNKGIHAQRGDFQNLVNATWNSATKDLQHDDFFPIVVEADTWIVLSAAGATGIPINTPFRVLSKPNSTTLRLEISLSTNSVWGGATGGGPGAGYATASWNNTAKSLTAPAFSLLSDAQLASSRISFTSVATSGIPGSSVFGIASRTGTTLFLQNTNGSAITVGTADSAGIAWVLDGGVDCSKAGHIFGTPPTPLPRSTFTTNYLKIDGFVGNIENVLRPITQIDMALPVYTGAVWDSVAKTLTHASFVNLPTITASSPVLRAIIGVAGGSGLSTSPTGYQISNHSNGSTSITLAGTPTTTNSSNVEGMTNWLLVTANSFIPELVGKGSLVTIAGVATSVNAQQVVISVPSTNKFTFAGTLSPLPWTTPGGTANFSSLIHNTSGMAISGVELAEIVLNFDISTSQPVIAFWPWQSGGGPLGGNLDNGHVRFIAPASAAPISAYAGFHPNTVGQFEVSRVRYGASNITNGQLDQLQYPTIEVALGNDQVVSLATGFQESGYEEELAYHPDTGMVAGFYTNRIANCTPTSDPLTAASWNNTTKTVTGSGVGNIHATQGIGPNTKVTFSAVGASGLDVGFAYPVTAVVLSVGNVSGFVLNDAAGDGSHVGTASASGLTGSVTGLVIGPCQDQRMRVFTERGVAQFSSDRLATVNPDYSQWRGLSCAVQGAGGEKRWALVYTCGPGDLPRMSIVEADPASPSAFTALVDIPIQDVSGQSRQDDPDVCQLQDGSRRLMTIHDDTHGGGGSSFRALKRQLYDGTTYAKQGTNATVGTVYPSAQTTYPAHDKVGPRITADSDRIWIFYCAVNFDAFGDTYDGTAVWAVILSADATTTINPGFRVAGWSGVAGSGLARAPEMAVLRSGAVIMVWEEYPNGTLPPPNIAPSYVTPCNVMCQLFNKNGVALCAPFQVNSAVSAGGSHSFALYPHVTVSLDGTQAMVTWTASGNSNIYNPTSGTTVKPLVWARTIDLSNFAVPIFTRPEWQFESIFSNPINLTSHSFARAVATRGTGNGGWALTYREGDIMRIRFFDRDGLQETKYPPTSVGLAGTIFLYQGRAQPFLELPSQFQTSPGALDLFLPTLTSPTSPNFTLLPITVEAPQNIDLTLLAKTVTVFDPGDAGLSSVDVATSDIDVFLSSQRINIHRVQLDGVDAPFIAHLEPIVSVDTSKTLLEISIVQSKPDKNILPVELGKSCTLLPLTVEHAEVVDLATLQTPRFDTLPLMLEAPVEINLNIIVLRHRQLVLEALEGVTIQLDPIDVVVVPQVGSGFPIADEVVSFTLSITRLVTGVPLNLRQLVLLDMTLEGVNYNYGAGNSYWRHWHGL